MPGYNVTTLEPARGGIICPHCRLILRDAVQTIEEGYRLCESCYKEISYLPSRSCEECGISLGPEEKFYPDRAVRRDVLQSIVHCTHHSNGCVWVGQLQDSEEHTRQCRYKPVNCPNDGCEQLLVPDELDRHIDEECPYRTVKCGHCGQQERANSLDAHYTVCPKYPIECGQCKERVSRDGLDHHQQHKCPFLVCSVQGCGQKLRRVSVPPQSANESTSEHLRDPGRLFHHVHGLGLAVADALKQTQQLTLDSATHSGAPRLDSAVKGVENKLIALQRTVENDRILMGREIKQLKLTLKQRDEKLEELEQKLVSLEREGKRYRAQSRDTGAELGTDRVWTVERRLEELERQTALVKVHVSELELQLQASLASTHDGSFLWRIPDVSRRRRDAMDERVTSIYSPPFYTGRKGYKMCIRAYLNGDGIGYGTHLSLFFVLMKGEYDHLLKWPFNSKVSLILVDQNHRKHIVQTFKPSAESSSFQRPRSDMNVASGCPQFAKLSILDNENYVREDVMYIKCVVSLDSMHDRLSPPRLSERRRDAEEERVTPAAGHCVIQCRWCGFRGTASELEVHEGECLNRLDHFPGHGSTEPQASVQCTTLYTAKRLVPRLLSLLSDLQSRLNNCAHCECEAVLANKLNELEQVEQALSEEGEMLELVHEIQTSLNQLYKDLGTTPTTQHHELLQSFKRKLRDWQKKLRCMAGHQLP